MDFGKFDETYAPAYAEDLEFCARVQKAGGKILVASETTIVHHLSVSMASSPSIDKVYQSAINKQKFNRKYLDFFSKKNSIKPIAFYLPQFHDVDENSFWWGAGYTEWRAVANAKPYFLNHYQPHIPEQMGFYDLSHTEIFEKQASLARKYGIHGFCFYYYNFGDVELLEKPLETFIASSADIQFCLCWANENWTRAWDGKEKNILMEQKANNNNEFLNVLKQMERLIKDNRYIRVDGKPMILIYRPALFEDIQTKMALWRRYWMEKYGEGLYLCVVDSMERAVDHREKPENLGFDAAVEFPVHNISSRLSLNKHERLANVDFEGVLIDYTDAVVEICSRPHPGYKRFPGVFPSWDNTPRRGKSGTIFHNVHPSKFQAYLEHKCKEAMLYSGDERMVFINAWNEWGEGAHLEPDLEYGNSWLHVIETVVREN